MKMFWVILLDHFIPLPAWSHCCQEALHSYGSVHTCMEGETAVLELLRIPFRASDILRYVPLLRAAKLLDPK